MRKWKPDTQDITLEACQDWYRVLALGTDTSVTDETKTSHSDFNLVTEFWPEPNSFISQFSKALNGHNALNVQAPENISVEFKSLVEQAIASLNQHKDMLTVSLIDVKKRAQTEKNASKS